MTILCFKHCLVPFHFFHRPENVPRLFDLIKVEDPKISNAFFFAVRNTLVGNTLEQATRIAYGKVNSLLCCFLDVFVFLRVRSVIFSMQMNHNIAILVARGKLVEESNLAITSCRSRSFETFP